MTVADLCVAPWFLDACAAWERDGRAPLHAADLFYERGLTGMGAAWEWAAMTVRKGCIYVRPRRDMPIWYWWTDDDGLSSSLPRPFRTNECRGRYGRIDSPTFPAAIAWMLVRSVEVYGDAGPGRKEQAA